MNQYSSQKLAKSRTSLYESKASHLNKSVASSNQSIMLSSLNSSSLSSIDSFDADTLANRTVNENLLNIRAAKHKLPDSDDFNYWFECASFVTGTINLDLALDKGEPLQQVEWLRLHDNKTKRLWFLWTQQPAAGSSKHVCGCVGGCSFYSVFDTKFDYPAENYTLRADDYFFNMRKSISRDNPNFGRSLFVKDRHILDSHPIMTDKYSIE